MKHIAENTFYQRYEILNILCRCIPLVNLSSMGEKTFLQHKDQRVIGVRNVLFVLTVHHSSNTVYTESTWRGVGEWRQEGG